MSLSKNVIGITALLVFYYFGNGNVFVECTNQGHVIILTNSLGGFTDGGGYDNNNVQSGKGYSSGRNSEGAISRDAQSQGFGSNQKSRRGLNGVLTVLQTNGHSGGKGQNGYQFQNVNPFDGLHESTQGRKARENPPVSSHVAIPLTDPSEQSGGFGSLGKGTPNQGISYDRPQKHQMVPTPVGKGSSGGWQQDNSFDGRVFYNGHQGVVALPMESIKGGGDAQLNSKGGFGSFDGDSHKGRGGTIDYAKGGVSNQNSFNLGKGNPGNSGTNSLHPQGPGKGASSGKGQSGPWDNKKGSSVDQVPQTKQSRTPKRRVVVIPVLKHVAVVEHVPVIEHIKVITDDDTLQGLDGKSLSLGRSSLYGGQLGINYNDGDDIAQGISGADFQNLKGLPGNTVLGGGGLNTGSGKSLPAPSIPSSKDSHSGTTARTKDLGGGSIQQDAFGDFGKGSYPSNVPAAGIHNVNEFRSGGKTFIIFHTTDSGKGQFSQADNAGGSKGGQKGFDTGSYGNGYHQVNQEPNNFYGSGKTSQNGAGNINFQQGGHSFQPSGKTNGGFHSGGDNSKGSQDAKSGFQGGQSFTVFNSVSDTGHEVRGISSGGQKGTNAGFVGFDQGYADGGWSVDSVSKNGGGNKGTDFSGGISTVYSGSGKGGPTGGKGANFNNIGHQNTGSSISQTGKNEFPPADQSFSFDDKGADAGGGGAGIKGTNLGTGGGKNFPEQQIPKGNIVEGIDLRLIESLLAASGSSDKNKLSDAGTQHQLQPGSKSYNGGGGGDLKGNAKDFRSNKRSTNNFADKSADGADARKFGGEMWW